MITLKNFIDCVNRSETGREFEKSSLECFFCSGKTFAIFSIEGTQEISFLSNFNILVGILVGPTDLLESNEGMKFSIPVLSERIKKRTLNLFLSKSEKCLHEKKLISLLY